jgi:hypothetical protein
MNKELNAIFLNKNLSKSEKIEEIYKLAKNQEDNALNQEALGFISLCVVDSNEDIQIHAGNYIIDLLGLDHKTDEEKSELNKWIIDHIIFLYEKNKSNRLKELNSGMETTIKDFIEILDSYHHLDLTFLDIKNLLCNIINILRFDEFNNFSKSLQYDLKQSYIRFLSKPCFSEKEKIVFITNYLLKNKEFPEATLLIEYGLSSLLEVAKSSNEPIKLLKLSIPFLSKQYSWDINYYAKKILNLLQNQLLVKENFDLMVLLLKLDKYIKIWDWALFSIRHILLEHREFRTSKIKTFISNFSNHIDKEIRLSARNILYDLEFNKGK